MAVGSIYLNGLTIPPAAAINAAATPQQRTISAAADRSVIPLIYGQVQVPGDVLNIIEHATDANAYLVQVMWCHACHAIGTPLLNALALPSGSAFTHYTGSQTTADADLVAAMLAKGVTYTDTLAGIAYSVIKLPTKDFTGELTLTAVVQGRRVYDPRLDSTAGGSGAHRLADPGTWEWSDNPALCLADWIDSATYGADDAVVWGSVPDAADACDALVGGSEKRRTLHLAITEPVRIADLAEALRAYAGCWLVPTRYGISLLPDADDASVATYSHASGHIAAIGNITTRDRIGSPTVVEVAYTDDSQTPSRDGTAVAALPGAGDTIPWRQSSVRLPGINRYSQALREATERLNKLNLEAYSTTLDVFDIGIRHEIGDIITVSHPAGLVSAPMRITDAPQMPRLGRWRLPVTQHDPLAYDDEVATIPGYGDPGVLVVAGPPSNVTGLGAEIANGVVRQYWDPCLDIDYRETEIRDADEGWGDPITYPPLFRGRVNEWQEIVTVVGTLTRYYRHYDYSGLSSAVTSSQSIVITEEGLPSTGLNGFVLKLTPGTATVVADADGNVTDFSGAFTTATVARDNGDDVTADWTFSKVDVGVISTIGGALGNEIQVTGFDDASANSAYNNVVLQCHLDGNYTDTSRYRRTPLVIGADVDFGTTAPAMGTGYAAFTGGGEVSRNRVGWGFDPTFKVATGQQWSIRMWVRLNSYPGASNTWYFAGTAYKAFNWTGTPTNATLSMTWIADSSPGLFVAQSPGPFALNTWYFIEASYCADGRLRIFVDGVLNGTSATVNTSAKDASASNNTTFLIGTHYDAGPSDKHIDGDIDDVQYIVGPGGNEAAYTRPTAPFPDGPYLPYAYVDVTATGPAGEVLTARWPVNTVATAPSTVTASLSNPAVTVAANSAGVVTSLSGASSSINLMVQGVNTYALWTIAGASSNAGITYSISGGVVTVTAFPTAITTGTITLTCSRAGFPTQVLVLGITKIVAAADVIVAQYQPGQIILNADWQGVVGSYTGASVTVSIKINNSETVGSWSLSAAPIPSNPGIALSFSGAVLSITDWPDALTVGTIRVTATRSGYATQVIDMTVAMQYAAQPGRTISADRTLITLPADTNGVVQSYAGASMTVTVLEGAGDATNTYTWSLLYDADYLTVGLSGSTATLTNLDTDWIAESFSIVGTKAGWQDVFVNCQIVLNRALPPTGDVAAWGSLATWAYANSGTASARIILRSDGSIVARNNSLAIEQAKGAYYTPITAGIGSSRWAKLTKLAGDDPTSPALDTVLAMSGGLTLLLTRATTGSSESSLLVEIYSDAGGTTKVSEGRVYLVSEVNT